MDFKDIQANYLDEEGLITDINALMNLTPKPHNLFKINYSDQVVENDYKNVQMDHDTFNKALNTLNLD